MKAKEYIKPEIAVMVMEEALMSDFSGYNNDGERQGDVKDSFDEEEWGMND